jgi:hypothetical protein
LTQVAWQLPFTHAAEQVESTQTAMQSESVVQLSENAHSPLTHLFETQSASATHGSPKGTAHRPFESFGPVATQTSGDGHGDPAQPHFPRWQKGASAR